MPVVTKNVEVEVDVDLSDFDTDELLEELADRDESPQFATEAPAKIFEAFYVGNEALAIELTRKFVQIATGRVLP